ncbi:hypothetical protein T484DRAFT_1862161 [Baffinella frigidus]|nr:hypothetical protein T484DRAFT_1862161 [Cryptophyta sp. CCMP2293]
MGAAGNRMSFLVGEKSWMRAQEKEASKASLPGAPSLRRAQRLLVVFSVAAVPEVFVRLDGAPHVGVWLLELMVPALGGVAISHERTVLAGAELRLGGRMAREQHRRMGRVRGQRTHNAISDHGRKKIFLMIYDENLPVKEIVLRHKNVKSAPQRTAVYDLARQFECCGEWRRFAYLAWVAEQNGKGHLVGSRDERVQAAAHASRARRCDALPAAHVASIGALLQETPELYLEELQRKLLAGGASAGIDAISRAGVAVVVVVVVVLADAGLI